MIGITYLMKLNIFFMFHKNYSEIWKIKICGRNYYNYIGTLYRVRHNYGKQGLMKRYKFNSLRAINLTRG